MDLNDKELKRLYRTYIDGRRKDSRKDCPSMEILLSFFKKRKQTRKKMRIVDHVTRCSACAKEFEFMLELRRYEDKLALQFREARPQGPSSLPSGLTSSLFWKYASSIIGMALIFTFLGIIIKELAREDLTRATRSCIELIQPEQGRPATLPLIFKWQMIARAKTYILEIFDESLLPFWKSSAVPTTIIVLPDDVIARLLPGQAYYWTVTAFSRDGKLAESGFFSFSISRKET